MSDIENKLKELDEKIRECKRCAHREQIPKNLPTVQIRDTCSRILFVGRDPARGGWRESGKAFFRSDGKLISSGKNFNKQLKEIGGNIEGINFVELIKCFPESGKIRTPKRDEIENCKEWLYNQINIIQPKVIVPMGKEPTEFFKGETIKMENAAGKKFYWQNFAIIPIFHPSGANMRLNPRNIEILKNIFKENEASK